MPVAISISDTANSAAQFLDEGATGVAAFLVTSQAADTNNSTASLISKDQKSSGEDFDAVLALLMNGGVPPLQQPTVLVKTETNSVESGASDLTITFSETASIATGESNTTGNAELVSVGQLLLHQDSVAKQMSANPGIQKASQAISENGSTDVTAESSPVPDASLASKTATTVASPEFLTNLATVDRSPAATIQPGQSSAPPKTTGIVDDTEIVPRPLPVDQTGESQIGEIPGMPTRVVPIHSVGTNVADTEVVDTNVADTELADTTVAGTNVDHTTTAATNVADRAIPIQGSVLAEPSESVRAKPLSSDMIRALERIGRPLESGIDLDQESQSKVLAGNSQISSVTESVSLAVEPQSGVDSVPALNPTLVAVPRTPKTPSVKSGKAEIDQQLSLSPEVNAQVSGLTKMTSPSAEKQLRPVPSESSQAETGRTTTFELSAPAPESAARTPGSMFPESEQLQPSVASLSRRKSPDENSFVSDDSKPQIDPSSDATTATQQSGLAASVSPNSVPDLAASISAEIRQPLTSQVSRAIMEHVESHGVRQSDSLSVRLDPPELGEMTIELSKSHEGLAVRVTAREAVTMDMLFARGQEIESQLRGQHMNLKSLEFLRTDMSNSGFSHGQGQSQQQFGSSRRSDHQLNQIRSGTRGLSPLNASIRNAIPDSPYGLSFRA